MPPQKEKVDVNSYFQAHKRKDFLALVKESTTMSFKHKKTNGKLNKEVYPIIAIAEKYGLPLIQVGNYCKCPCPFHKETNPSLTFYHHTGSFYCFGCGAAGDALELMKKLEALRGNNYNYMEIVEMAKNL